MRIIEAVRTLGSSQRYADAKAGAPVPADCFGNRANAELLRRDDRADDAVAQPLAQQRPGQCRPVFLAVPIDERDT